MKISGITEQSFQPLRLSENIVIIEENEDFKNNEKIFIGEFNINDGGLTLDCDYDEVKNLAIQKARSVGGNVIKIIEHKLPSTWSTCHRIKFTVYKLENIDIYKKEIIWKPNTKLTWEDFKGSPKIERSSFLCGYIKVRFNDFNFPKGKGVVEILPLFVYECSYVQPLKKSSSLLKYNQIKFNLLEYYSRRMRSEFKKSNINTIDSWIKFAKSIYDKVYADYETDLFNLETETEFGDNYTGIVSWDFKLDEKLKELTEFSTDKY